MHLSVGPHTVMPGGELVIAFFAVYLVIVGICAFAIRHLPPIVAKICFGLGCCLLVGSPPFTLFVFYFTDYSLFKALHQVPNALFGISPIVVPLLLAPLVPRRRKPSTQP